MDQRNQLQQVPKPLKIRCVDSDCERQLHCFRATRKLRQLNQQGRCRYCGADLIDWHRLHRRDPADVDFTFGALRMELIRHYFWHLEIDRRAVNYACRKGRVGLREAAERRIRKSVGPANPAFDGRQTPRENSGNPLFYGQHATASCCRKCIEYWHDIPLGRELTEQEVAYLSSLVVRFVDDRIPLTDEGEKVPPLRKK